MGTGFLTRKGIIPQVERVEFINNGMLCKTLRCRCDIIVLNVYAPNEGKSDDKKN
jgi:hypothetical protein